MKALKRSILSLSIAICLAPLCASAENVELAGLLGSSSQCALHSSASELCDARAVFLSGEIELRAATMVQSVAVDDDGVFSAAVPAGRYRVVLRRLRNNGARLNSRSFRVRPRTLLLSAASGPIYLMVSHRAQPAGPTPGVGF